MNRALVAGLGLALALGSARGDEARAQVEQRIRLAARLFADSPTALRIAASGHERAGSHLDEGRLHHALAEDALQRGDLATARREVEEALRHAGLARRLVPDDAQKRTASRLRQQQLSAALDKLVEAWQAHAGPGDVQDGDLVAALGLMGTARFFGEAGRHAEAVHTLEAAERHVLSGMNRALQSRELDYTQRAATPEQEFQLELQRHQGMADLLPLAVSELKPRPETLALIERAAEQGRALRAQAQQRFQAGQTGAALADLRAAMQQLQRALQVAGVALPAATGGPP